MSPLLRAALLLVPLASCTSAPALETRQYEPYIAAAVAHRLEGMHYQASTHRMTDALSREWLAAYLDYLDYAHMVFLASDVAEFQAKYGDKLDDSVKGDAADLTAAREIYARWQQRLTERYTEALELVKAPINVETSDTWALDRNKAPWPADAAEAKALWSKRVTEDMIRLELGARDDASARELLTKRYNRVLDDMRRGESIDVVEAYTISLAHLYDPHTTYFKPARRDDFDIDLSNAVEGIGATLRTDGEYTMVVELVPGGPASRDGRLQAGDRIVAVAQGNGEPEDVIDRRIDGVVRLIRGKKGSIVKLTVLPKDGEPGQTRIVDITRDRVVLEDSSAKGKLETTTNAGVTTKVGVIDVPGFYVDPKSRRSVTADIARITLDLKSQGAEAIVLDLRKNGGGSLGEAISVTGLFIDAGPVVQTRDSLDRRENLEDEQRGTIWDGPLVVLVSPFSASASEIVAAALQDHGRALIVGSEKTHGKGTVQIVLPVANDFPRSAQPAANMPDPAGALKLTVQQFFRINGRSVQLDGVHSDIVLPTPYDGLDVFESDLDHALPASAIDPVAYAPAQLAPVIASLRPLSQGRVAQDPELQKYVENAKRRQADEGIVALSLSKRRQELLDQGAELPDAPEDEDALPKKAEDEPDPMLDEALRVTSDFVRMSAKRVVNAR